jgi:hypothetical protein
VGIEVDDEHALIPLGQGISGADRDIVENAEPHALVSLGVVAGWPHRAKRALDGPLETLVHRLQDRAGCVERRLKAVRGSSSPAPKFLIFSMYSRECTRAMSSSPALRGFSGIREGHRPAALSATMTWISRSFESGCQTGGSWRRNTSS